MPTKFDLAVMLAALTAGALFIEASRRTEIMPPVVIAPADRCADSDMRYAASRLMFLDGGFVSGLNRRQIAERLAPDCAR